ncbi:hypothetical protein [Pedobacter foliorum]|uniref:hypothetical protein n=1 Tax=Pedobacter foliorum TaxID=2739058 RepID=UPI001564AEAA|nr:hypothetical protein [Pedobacter foliorum]NRF38038.1 hypothetical protein [Pedobacter foliorum]
MTLLFETNVLWSTDYELTQKNEYDHMAAQFSGIPPIHDHQGDLRLTDGNILIEGDVDLIINLSDIEQLYRGFDEFYRPNFIKNLGLFCQPVRIKYTERFSIHTIYLIAGYNFLGCTNGKALFNMLQKMLS